MAQLRHAANDSVAAAFLRRHRDAILTDWLARAHATAAGRTLPEPLLRDHVPQLLDDLAAYVAGARDELPNAAVHAIERFGQGFVVGALLEELSLLRASMLAIWQRERIAGSLDDLVTLELALDRAMTVAVTHYDHAVQADREHVLARLESLLSASPVGIAFLDRDLRYVRINDALARLNGKPAGEHVGRLVGEILPDVSDHLVQLLRGVLDTGEPALNLELVVPATMAAAGRHTLANYFPVRGPEGVIGVGAIVIDVTDAKQAESALRREQARLQSIIEHAPAAIWAKDAAGRIVLANHQVAEALGVAFEELLGSASDDVLPPEFARQHEEHDRIVLAENRALEAEETTPSPDGVRTFLTVKFPIPGEPPLIGGIATEITDRKHIEEQLRTAVRTREEVMAVVSHDLRNPLSTIQLSTTLLTAQLGADHRPKRHLEMIHRACTRMESLIDDLLDTARLREGRFEIEVKREPIEKVVAEALDLQAPLADEKRIALVRESDVAGIEVDCDRDRIIQVFANLVGNALKFCRAGDTITVRAARAGDDVEISVADTGPGIDAEQLPRVFDPYWSGDTHRRHGSGLGLYIVRGIVERHGGRIGVTSTRGAGATFTFTLPIAR